jgi:hypothetical protein
VLDTRTKAEAQDDSFNVHLSTNHQKKELQGHRGLLDPFEKGRDPAAERRNRPFIQQTTVISKE